MNEEIKEQISEIFEIDEDDVTLELSQQTLNNWDSMNHLKLVTSDEEEFDISLMMNDIEEISTVTKLVEVTEKCKNS